MRGNQLYERQSDVDTTYHLERESYSSVLFDDETLLPHRYVFVVTNKCNLRCDFCFQDKKSLSGAMNLNDWKAVVDQLPSYAWVTLTGGEPFFFKEFRELFEYVAKKHKCNVITNGLLLTEALTNFLLSYTNFKTLSVSIDNISNSIRGVKPEDWTKTENQLRFFSQHPKKKANNVILDAKTVVLDGNAAELYDIFKYCTESVGVDTHAFQFLKGSPIQHSDIMFEYDALLKTSFAPTYSKWKTIQEQLELVRLHKASSDRRSFVHPKFISLRSNSKPDTAGLAHLNQELHRAESFRTCKSLWESVHINADGELFPCFAVSFGNVKRQSIQNIMNGDKCLAVRKLIKERGTVPACNRCGYLRLKDRGENF